MATLANGMQLCCVNLITKQSEEIGDRRLLVIMLQKKNIRLLET